MRVEDTVSCRRIFRIPILQNAYSNDIGGNYRRRLHGRRRMSRENTRSRKPSGNHGTRPVTSEWKIQAEAPPGHGAQATHRSSHGLAFSPPSNSRNNSRAIEATVLVKSIAFHPPKNAEDTSEWSMIFTFIPIFLLSCFARVYKTWKERIICFFLINAYDFWINMQL